MVPDYPASQTQKTRLNPETAGSGWLQGKDVFLKQVSHEPDIVCKLILKFL